MKHPPLIVMKGTENHMFEGTLLSGLVTDNNGDKRSTRLWTLCVCLNKKPL